jgi:hypothetical protein
MIDIETLEAEAKANEPKTIYNMYKVSCNCAEGTDCGCLEEWYTPTLNGGSSAKAVVVDKTITLTYIDGSTATYTEQ